MPAPEQQSESVAQASNCCPQAGGGSQVQVVSPGTDEQAVTTPPPSRKKQPSPAQQAASAVQCCACGVQSWGTWQVPPRHCSSALQQLTVPEHDSPVAAQTLPVPQVPLVAPAGTSQARPAQQSPLVVQVLPDPTQGGRQVPPSQLPAQQSACTVHDWPTCRVQPVAGVHLKAWLSGSSWQASGSQQEGSSTPPQAPLRGVQAEISAHRSTPSAPGTHGASPQHCSRNWQTEPGPVPWGMQQAGLVPSQPVGQVWSTGPP